MVVGGGDTIVAGGGDLEAAGAALAAASPARCLRARNLWMRGRPADGGSGGAALAAGVVEATGGERVGGLMTFCCT